MTSIFAGVLQCSVSATVVNYFRTLFYTLRRYVKGESNVSYSAHLMQVGYSIGNCKNFMQLNLLALVEAQTT